MSKTIRQSLYDFSKRPVKVGDTKFFVGANGEELDDMIAQLSQLVKEIISDDEPDLYYIDGDYDSSYDVCRRNELRSEERERARGLGLNL